MPAMEIMLIISKFVERTRTDFFFKSQNISGFSVLSKKSIQIKEVIKRDEEGNELGQYMEIPMGLIKL